MASLLGGMPGAGPKANQQGLKRSAPGSADLRVGQAQKRIGEIDGY
jgi:hypothetical protein